MSNGVVGGPVWRVKVVAMVAMALLVGGCDEKKTTPAQRGPERTTLEPASGGEPTSAITGAPAEEEVIGEDLKARVKARVLELIDACRAVDKAAVIPRLVYRGDDVARRWKTPMSPADPQALEDASELCARVLVGVDGGGRPTFLNFSAERESEGQWLVWDVRFDGGTRAVRQAFAFLEIDGAYLLGDID